MPGAVGGFIDQAPDACVEPAAGSETPIPPQHDSHIRAWIALHTTCPRPRPVVGCAPTDAPRAPLEHADTIATEPAEDPTAPWLQGLSSFGPPLEKETPHNNIFDEPDPAPPAWPSHLQDEWVSPTEFPDLWRPDWLKTFAPLYSATRKWQRLWRQEQGRPQKGWFVGGDLLYRVGPYSDRLCVPSRAQPHKSRSSNYFTILQWRDTTAYTRPKQEFRSDTTGVGCGQTSTTS